MKKFLVSIIAGIILVWLFVPFFKTQSDKKGSLNKRQRGAKMAVAVEASPIQIENIKDIGNFHWHLDCQIKKSTLYQKFLEE